MPEPTVVSFRWSSVDELQSIAENSAETLQKSDKLPKLWTAFNTLYKEGVKHLDQNNEEMAYILLYRSIMCFTCIRSKNENKDSDQRFFKIRYGADVANAIRQLEILKESLMKKYQMQKQLEAKFNGAEETMKKSQENGQNLMITNEISLDPAPVTKESKNTTSKSNENDMYGYISSRELYSIAVEKYPTSTSTLILDIRLKEDFDKSTLKLNDVINVPENIIVPGSIATKLESMLEERFKPFFKKRGDYDHIVIVDRSSKEAVFGSKILQLITILVKWDVRTKYKSKPVILEGGFEDWHSRYPCCTTNPLFTPPNKTKNNNFFSIDTITYPSYDLFDPEKIRTNIPSSQETIPRPTVDRSTKPLIVEKKIEHETSNINGMEPKTTTVDVVEDRVTKIVAESDLSKEKKDEIMKKETNENSGNENKSIQSHGSKVQRPGLDDTTNRIYTSNLGFNDNNSGQIGNRNDDFRDEDDTDENQIVDSTSTNNIRIESGNSSKMKRYSSTPNISKVGMNEDVKPPIDRSTKPSNDDQLNYYTMNSSYIDTGKGLTGLKNIGNTCYMNSIIQCLSNTEPLRKHLCSIDSRVINEKSKTRGAVAHEVISILKQLWSSDYGAISCRSLKNIIGQHNEMFSGYDQQDSHEFLTILIDWLHEDLNEPSSIRNLDGASEKTGEKAWGEFSKKNNSIIKQLFYGQLKSTVSCKVCTAQSITFEPFSNLSLPLPSDEMSKCSIGDCLKLYTSNDEVDKWQCPKCKDFRRATKKLDITKLPPLLVVHFKRFTSVGGCKKQKTFVDFPETLDMKPFVIGSEHRNNRYQLYAVSNHSGSMESGHYTAYCKNSIDRRWYLFDDQSVHPSSLITSKSREAYITFYQTMGN